MEENFSFGYWVRRRRKALDMTQAELGRRAGASAAMIRKIEADERRPSRELARSLADQLAIPVQEREAFLLAARKFDAVSRLPAAAGPARKPLPALPPAANLPAPMTSLVNRVTALAEVGALLNRDGVRLVTLIGPPGIGKTRLSIQAAWQVRAAFTGGAHFVDLSAIRDPHQILPAVALALDLPPAPGLAPARRVAAELRDKELLLVLDNLEQIVEDAGLIIADLLRACPDLKVLATSRIRLDIYGEHEYKVPPMTVPPAETYMPAELLNYEAVQLFLDRARQHQADFDLGPETARFVAEICRHLDGLPLALELAAARTRQLALPELEAALRETSGREWHTLLETTTRDLPPRQQTLFNAIAWSYSLLGPAEQAVLCRLGIFQGSFDAPAAAAVCVDPVADEAGIVPILTLLGDHNLVSQVARQPARWRLLETIREFAVAQLDSEEHETLRRRHMVCFAARQRDWYEDWSAPSYVQVVEMDLDNYRAALRTALDQENAPLAFQLGIVLGKYWERVWLLDEGRGVLQQVLALPGAVEPRTRFPVLHDAITQAFMQHDFIAAEALSAEALALTHDGGLPRATATILNLLGRIYLEQARYEEAERVLLEAIAISDSLEPPRPSDFERIQRGEVALARGLLDEAQAYTQAGLAAFSANELVPFTMGWTNLAEVSLARGDAAAVGEALRQALPVAHLHIRRARFLLIAFVGFLLADQDAGGMRALMAVRLLSFVSAATKRAGDSLSPHAQSLMQARNARARATVPAARWQAAWDEGQSWTLEQALAAAQQAL